MFGQPRGLFTLFFTEMWERFAFYGMRAILILYMVDAVTGLGIDDRTASAIYGLYLGCGYLLSLLGGYIADRLIGQQRAVLAGGVLITIGNAVLISNTPQIFFLGMLLNIFGVGLLKPNVSAIVAQLYPEGGSRRDAGFSIFYMGINTGSFLGSLLVPLFAARYGWHWGFALPAIGMLFGLAQFLKSRHHLGDRRPRAGTGCQTRLLAAHHRVVRCCCRGRGAGGGGYHQPGCEPAVGGDELADCRAGIRVLHLPDLLCRADGRRAQTRLCLDCLIHWLRDLLRGLRADGCLLQPVRPALYRTAPARVGSARRCAAGREPAVHHRLRPRFSRSCGCFSDGTIGTCRRRPNSAPG